jgi:hypothetical protein
MRHNSFNYLRTFFIALTGTAFLVTAGVGFAGKQIGAIVTPEQLAKIQAADHDKIVLPFDLRYGAELKLARARTERPEVIVISSSRAGEMRAEMIHPYSFYNMSFSAWTIDQTIDVLDHVTREVPVRLAIVELDYFMFTDQWETSYKDREVHFNPAGYVYSSAVDMLRMTVKYADQFLPFIRGTETVFVGTRAIFRNEGFRFDGSMVHLESRVRETRLHNLNAAFLVGAMPGASSISPKQMESLGRLAKLAQQRHVTLVGIQLPMFKEGIDYLDTNSSYHYYSGVWREFESASTRRAFQDMGIDFFDLARDPLNANAENFVDAYHLSDLGMLRSMGSLLRLPAFRNLFPAIDPRRIDELIANQRAAQPQQP